MAALQLGPKKKSIPLNGFYIEPVSSRQASLKQCPEPRKYETPYAPRRRSLPHDASDVRVPEEREAPFLPILAELLVLGTDAPGVLAVDEVARF